MKVSAYRVLLKVAVVLLFPLCSMLASAAGGPLSGGGDVLIAQRDADNRSSNDKPSHDNNNVVTSEMPEDDSKASPSTPPEHDDNKLVTSEPTEAEPSTSKKSKPSDSDNNQQQQTRETPRSSDNQ